MNFESIEGLNSEDIEYLYENTMRNDSEMLAIYQKSLCFCKTNYLDPNSKCVFSSDTKARGCNVRGDNYIVFSEASCRTKCATNACAFEGAAVYIIPFAENTYTLQDCFYHMASQVDTVGFQGNTSFTWPLSPSGLGAYLLDPIILYGYNTSTVFVHYRTSCDNMPR